MARAGISGPDARRRAWWSTRPYRAGDLSIPLSEDVLKTYLFLLGGSVLIAVAVLVVTSAGLPFISGLLRRSITRQGTADFMLGGAIFVTLLGAGIVYLRRSPDDAFWVGRLALAALVVATGSLLVPMGIGLWPRFRITTLLSFWASLFVLGFAVHEDGDRMQRARVRHARAMRRRARRRGPGRTSPPLGRPPSKARYLGPRR
ncbi:MAG: hypothetical protein ACRDJ4_14965 [Actinomycetota bacterium]